MEPPLHMSYICYWLPKSPCCYPSRWCEGVSRFRVKSVSLSGCRRVLTEHAIDGVNEEEAICGGLITKVIREKGSAGQNLSGRARAIFTRAVNLRGFPPGVPTGVGKNNWL